MQTVNIAPPPSRHRELHQNYLAFPETIAQSIANISPTLTPVLSIPLVVASAGNGTWLAYVIATLGLLLVGLNIAAFAQRHASAGALYDYIFEGLGQTPGFLGGWAMLAAYLSTAMALLVGFSIFVVQILGHFHIHISYLLVEIIGLFVAAMLAYKDIRISSLTALIMEFSSVLLISIFSMIILFRHKSLWDAAQISLIHVHSSGIALGLVLGVFSFVGFESSTTLGQEAKNPHRSIPAAVIISVLVAGIFFTLMAYFEVLAFPGGLVSLSQSTAPLNTMATSYHLGAFSLLIDLGAMISLFSCALASLNAGARILFAMGRNRHIHDWVGQTHTVNRTPHIAIVIASIIIILALIGLAEAKPLNAYGYFGTFATYGFLVSYLLVSLASPLIDRKQSRPWIGSLMRSFGAISFLLIPIIGSIYPIPAYPYNILPYMFLGYIGIGFVWNRFGSSTNPLLHSTNRVVDNRITALSEEQEEEG
ncbi:APC family permease [Sulfobacillus thermosulfidooxidans]|uniref:APC family permease n=1 Tax=Sulfobacillus thermosulfidooxidans TaxID=28034 RepID=UPI0006B4F2DD|nr:APC family permease [Sulfobacillus thermosulfidooxidans]